MKNISWSPVQLKQISTLDSSNNWEQSLGKILWIWEKVILHGCFQSHKKTCKNLTIGISTLPRIVTIKSHWNQFKNIFTQVKWWNLTKIETRGVLALKLTLYRIMTIWSRVQCTTLSPSCCDAWYHSSCHVLSTLYVLFLNVQCPHKNCHANFYDKYKNVGMCWRKTYDFEFLAMKYA